MGISTQRFAKHHLIGFGFWQAWQMVVMCTNAVTPADAAHSVPTLTVILATTVGYIVIMGLCRPFPTILEGKAAIPVAATTMAAGTFVLMLTSSISDEPLRLAALAAGLTATSYGNAALLFMWGNLWSTLATGRAGRHLYFSYAFAFVPFFIAYALPHPAGGILCCLFPVASCLILASCKNEPRRKPSDAPFTPEHTLIVKSIGFVIVLSIIWGLSQHLVPRLLFPGTTAEFMAMSMVVAGATIGALALSMVVSSPPSEPVALYRPIVPAMAAGIAAFLALPAIWAFIGNGLLTMGIYCLDMFIMLIATDLAFRTRIPAPLVFGVALVSSRAGTFAGTVAASLLADAFPQAFSDSFIPTEATAVCFAALVFAGMLIFTQADLQKLYETPYQPQTTDPAPGTLTTAQRCTAVSEKYGLTARETEVLELLVRGRTVQGLCEELSIAQGTAKHHVSNIYRKLGVGDRRSVFDIVERATPIDE